MYTSDHQEDTTRHMQQNWDNYFSLETLSYGMIKRFAIVYSQVYNALCCKLGRNVIMWQ